MNNNVQRFFSPFLLQEELLIINYSIIPKNQEKNDNLCYLTGSSNIGRGLTARVGGLLHDGLEGIIDELAVYQEPEIALDGGFPLGDGRRVGLLLPLLGLIPSVQTHRDGPHFVHEPSVPCPRRLPLLVNIGGGGVDDHTPERQTNAGTPPGTEAEAVKLAAEGGGVDDGKGRTRGSAMTG